MNSPHIFAYKMLSERIYFDPRESRTKDHSLCSAFIRNYSYQSKCSFKDWYAESSGFSETRLSRAF